MMPEYHASFRIPDDVMDCWLRHFFNVIERRKMTGPCTCLPRSPDDQCPSHGYDTWKEVRTMPDNGKAKEELLSTEGYFFEEEWLSTCCGAPPSRATPDVGEDNPAGICGQCREHTGFERVEP